MEYFSARCIVWAILLGGISAVSLPLGSIVGLHTKPRQGAVSTLAAFGAGALIAAAMIPEAVHMGRANTVGLGTLTGFLAAISFKLLE